MQDVSLIEFAYPCALYAIKRTGAAFSVQELMEAEGTHFTTVEDLNPGDILVWERDKHENISDCVLTIGSRGPITTKIQQHRHFAVYEGDGLASDTTFEGTTTFYPVIRLMPLTERVFPTRVIKLDLVEEPLVNDHNSGKKYELTPLTTKQRAVLDFIKGYDGTPVAFQEIFDHFPFKRRCDLLQLLKRLLHSKRILSSFQSDDTYYWLAKRNTEEDKTPPVEAHPAVKFILDYLAAHPKAMQKEVCQAVVDAGIGSRATAYTLWCSLVVAGKIQPTPESNEGE